MKRLLLLFSLIFPSSSHSACSVFVSSATCVWTSSTTVFLTTGTVSWTVPANFNVSSNTIEAIGAGGSARQGGPGGGGGAYAKIYSWSGTGTVPVSISSGGAVNAASTWFASISTVAAQNGQQGAAGLFSASTGTVTYSGGFGSGLAGGGAAGPYGAGGNPTSTGGTGDNGQGGTAGNPGKEYLSIPPYYGSGGGGNAVPVTGGAGGNYGGGGGAGPSSGAGAGGPGLIVITYWPISLFSMPPSLMTLGVY